MGEVSRDAGDATVVLGGDGSLVDASPSALEMLGVSLDELRRLPAGALSAEPPSDAEREALRREWAASGATAAVGSTTVRRPDGALLRVKFLIDTQADGRYIAYLRPTSEPVESRPEFHTVGTVLAAWRAAERRLEALEPESPEWRATQSEIDSFRRQYREISDRRADGP